FAVVPLVMFTASRAKMGPYVAPRWLTALAVATAVLIIGLNAKLVLGYVTGGTGSRPGFHRRWARWALLLLGLAKPEACMTERRVLSACPHDCPDTCAMVTTVRDGRVVGVRGNPEHPFTRGGLCVKVKNFEERVYHPDRVLYPLRRTGAKGSGAFERISWD